MAKADVIESDEEEEVEEESPEEIEEEKEEKEEKKGEKPKKKKKVKKKTKQKQPEPQVVRVPYVISESEYKNMMIRRMDELHMKIDEVYKKLNLKRK